MPDLGTERLALRNMAVRRRGRSARVARARVAITRRLRALGVVVPVGIPSRELIRLALDRGRARTDG